MRFLLVALFLSVVALPVHAATPDELLQGLGTQSHGQMHMLFEVTFMSIDVATVDAFLADPLAAQVGGLVQGGTFNKDTRRSIREVLLTADPVVLRMTFVRDSGLDKFLKGVRRVLESAVKGEILSPGEFESIWPGLEEKFSFLEERGVVKGDAIYYRVDGETVQTVYLDLDGETLLEFSEVNEPRARGTRGGFFCKESKFSKKLIKSLFESGD